MSWKTKSFRLVALSVIAGPPALFAVEPRIIEPSATPPKIVFESDNAPYEVLDKFRNTRSSEQIHFQAIETLFPRVPERESVRQGYTMVKELVDAKKAAIEAAARLEEERVKLEAARAELESRAVDQWEVEAEEFDYYEFNGKDLEPQPEPEPKPKPKPKTATKSAHKHVHNHHHGHPQAKHQHNTHSATRPSAGRGLLGRLFQR